MEHTDSYVVVQVHGTYRYIDILWVVLGVQSSMEHSYRYVAIQWVVLGVGSSMEPPLAT